MEHLIRKIVGIAAAASLVLTPTLAYADRGRGGEARDVSSSRSSTVSQASSQSQRNGDDDGHRHGANRGPGNVNDRHEAEDDNDDDECVLLASGIVVNLHENDEDDDDCDSVATSTPDVSAPALSGIAVSPSATSAILSWSTNELSTSKVFFSTISPLVLNASTTLSTANSNLVTGHTVTLSGLVANTTYRFVVQSADATGNVSTSVESSFTTTSTSAATAPALSAISATPGTTTATIAFNTDVPAVATVFFGTQNPFSFLGALGNPAQILNHAFTLVGLTANTTYFYVVQASNAIGSAVSSLFTFTTQAVADVTAPTMSTVAATSTTAGTATLTWTTDEPASSKVFFGTSTPLNLLASTTPFVTNSALVSSHVVTVPALATSTTYHFVVQSADAAGNTSTSSDLQLFVQ